VRSPGSVVVGNQDVIAATMATLHEFPDRTLLGEDVIWSGTPETGMLSSHRLLSTATHSGEGVYGKATGKRLIYRIHADCHAKDNVDRRRMADPRPGRDRAPAGLGPEGLCRRTDRARGRAGGCVKPLTPETDRPGPYAGPAMTANGVSASPTS
jgi:hypothetical protein